MNLEFRPMPITDFDRYFEMDYIGGMGFDPGSALKEAVRVEHRFFNQVADPCWMVAHDLDRKGNTAIGFVAGCHITDWATEELINADEPYPHPKFLKWYRQGRNPFVTGSQIAAANAFEGLNLITTHFGWDRSLTLEQAAHIRSHVLSHYSAHYSGLRFKRMIAEVYSEASLADCYTAGFRVRNEYPSWTLAPNDRPFKPILLVLEREEALAGSNYFMMSLFAYQTPRIHFSDSQRELLLLARAGYSDRQSADALSISEDAIKARWKSIYSKVNSCMPDLLPENEADGRGPEKRRVLMTYLKNHPSEFWPFKTSAHIGCDRECRVP